MEVSIASAVARSTFEVERLKPKCLNSKMTTILLPTILCESMKEENFPQLGRFLVLCSSSRALLRPPRPKERTDADERVDGADGRTDTFSLRDGVVDRASSDRSIPGGRARS